MKNLNSLKVHVSQQINIKENKNVTKHLNLKIIKNHLPSLLVITKKLQK